MYNNKMQLLVQHLIDFVFPPSPEELKLRAISPTEFLNTSPKAGQSEFPFIKSVFSYKNPLVKELVWQIKYKKNRHAIECAGFALSNTLNEPALLIPIPISKKRRKERGYNQCELIIDEIVRLNNFKKDYTLLIRPKHIDKQTMKNREERIVNTRSIFEVTRKATSNERIVIIDDVSTTGSTLKEAEEALINAGYSNVECLTIAH